MNIIEDDISDIDGSFGNLGFCNNLINVLKSTWGSRLGSDEKSKSPIWKASFMGKLKEKIQQKKAEMLRGEGKR